MNPTSSPKFVVAGRWVVTRLWLDDSYRAGRWLDASLYEVSNQWRRPTSQSSEFPAAARWRERIRESGEGAYFGWRAALLISAPSRRDVYTRLITCGGGAVVQLPLPVKKPGNVAKQVRVRDTWPFCVQVSSCEPGSNWNVKPA